MSSSDTDCLLNALSFFSKYFGTTINASSVLHALPLESGKLTSNLFPKASSRCGLESKIVKRPFSQLNEGLFPVLLILKEGNPIVILSIENKKAKVLLLDGTQRQVETDISEIQKSYSGYAILVKKTFEFEKRSNFSTEKIRKNWFWGTLWRFRSLYARVGIVTFFINFFALTSSIFIMTVYDRVIPNQSMDTLFILSIGALIAYCFEFIIKSLRSFFVDKAGHRADLIMGGMLYDQILGMKFSKRPASAGSLASQARSYEGLREFFSSATITTLIDLPFIFVFTFIVSLLGGIVALPMLIGLVAALIIGIFMQWPINNAVKKSYQATNQRQAQTVETLNALETIKTTGSESILAAKMQACIHESAKADSKSRFYSQSAINLTVFIQHLVSIAIVVLSFFKISEGEMTMGAMFACVILSGRGMAPIGMLASILTRFQQSRRSLKGLNDIMKMEIDRPDDGLGVNLSVFLPSIKANNLSLSYPVGIDQKIDVIQNVSFEIKEGERVAILGKIGSGKSSLIRSMLGLYEPSDGSMEIGGVDIRQLNPSQYRKRIGYMSQDSGLLYGTLRSNLISGTPWATEETIWRSIERSGISELIHAHPAGIDFPIAEGGISLSGGQRQLICLARALIKEPDILIFDEPTSAMDTATEQMFKQKVTEYLEEDKKRMLIMATHKRSMLSMVDRVIVINNGKKVNDGAKDSILQATKKP